MTDTDTDMEAFRDSVVLWAAGGDGSRGKDGDPPAGSAGPGATARDLAARLGVRTVVLLEGPSDVAAVDALAERHGRNLAAEGVCVLAMGGAMSVGRFARILGRGGLGIRLVGLCDENELPFYERALAANGDDIANTRDTTAARAGVESASLFVCVADLEEELLRALGVARVREVVRVEGELRALETFLAQPAQRGRAPVQQLRRFLGTKKGRKIRYGRLLVEALGSTRAPAPLDDLLAAL